MAPGHRMEGEVESVAVYSIIEPRYEYCAPKYYDFSYEETEEDIVLAESWFNNAIPYEASPHASKTKSVAELITAAENSGQNSDNGAQQILAHVSPSPKQAIKQGDTNTEHQSSDLEEALVDLNVAREVDVVADPCTPARQHVSHGFSVAVSPIQALVTSPLPAKRLYSEAWSASATTQTQKPRTTPKRSSAVRRSYNSKRNKAAVREANALEETRARKKQKLDGGRLKQIQVVKPSTQDEKPKNQIALTVPQEFRFCTDARAHGDHSTGKVLQRCISVQMAREASPFVSMAERVQRFQQKTPERFHMLPATISCSQLADFEKPKLKLTRPKTPELGTMQRTRPSKMKSTAEIEEEMIANLPKFKARPLPKKILEAPTLPFAQKSTPQVPEFQEFHLHTMERAQQNPKHAFLMLTSSQDAQTDSAVARKERRNSAPGGSTGSLADVRPPRLQTALRARPISVKSTEEIEAEQLAKIPKFKARPLNKRIFKSKGDLGLLRNHKRQVTMPVEFRFQTGQRAQVRCPNLPLQDFEKLTLNREPTSEAVKPTRPPKPFHLATDDRGLAKKMKMIQEQIERDQKEAEARIPKAQPLPYTTKSPIIPHKPTPKTCTKPVPFQLVSLSRHEEEQQRRAAERAQAERLEALLKEFRAQPNLSNAPVFMPIRSNKPLTEIYEFKFNVDTRAVERAEFDKKVAEKQEMYKHYREEYEAARKAEEEKFIKAMRREMVVVARPVPKFDRPFVPQRSNKEPTRPVSPKFNLKTPRTDVRSSRSCGQETPVTQRRIMMR
ncbi:protein TPX2 isoform X1 [Physcomitrium patens]|uniref:TPX2 C-terminal domain-containing protein n=2 Tax=Physcomitrium patens TaxID=3218 RepID=A0A7I4FGJ8_PHYPA|nr:protein TPX2-like isoform X1 [Physcomitrium patens]XP_024361595.1 protein TPX2-like isoform X1 [Physcomitrium patens]|eukprot:XP_024361594.1 protein TPX2-like isoform X1 [Physcomitrella patens]